METPRIPAAPEELFACEWKGYAVLGSACLQLQCGDPDDEENRNRLCATGECIQGLKVRDALERARTATPIRICTQCRRVQLSEQNEDGLCSRCRPADAAPTPAPPPPAPTLAPTPEITVAEKTICNDPEGCDREAESKGKCGKHYQRWIKAGRPGDAAAAPKAAPTKPATAARKPRAPVQKVLLATPAVALPELAHVPNSFLLEAVDELVRRRDEIVMGTRRLGIKDTDASDEAA